MRKLLLISSLSCVAIATLAQNRCVAVKQKEATLYAKNASANVNSPKTIRLIIHFPLKSDGTENFTETKDCNGNTSSNNRGI